ncbi:hypothetical protein HBH56_135970 [Parastagonospora nodorum]|uniref:Uncharacterized protein n=1 Tax=Phaeosphaeria nodorum (strain SN15 / ATCC MYA-4574 / FGSC 10173) TaxID=321614 RepID=A0A7U2I5L4_PHANO|nr:hypothetical protein HBH56_135970 [Parastagonospora nodorum]QRD02539.1 hypothetical protein JI435_112930 [Parastagonospora nodorum SN15]KAH3927191.1 hypothetical protein HBH54_157320 [Parastagonospora nodorum]KAH3956495.1 hypothetical protein HBH51_240580 [Parastagonospora nodorum]KAH3974866.1 hypothetical protein HBH52_130650 [Parastagonospora nodorum]
MSDSSAGVDCKRCYSMISTSGCDKNISMNPDIAGIGILISFFLSALLLGTVIIWGYWMASLPSVLLTPADHYVIHMLKKISLHFRDPKVLSNISDDQIRRARTVTGYVKVLGDQQLITGLAIIIAALALRHEITLYEFRIVTSLAYFAAFTHLCSLYILR